MSDRVDVSLPNRNHLVIGISGSGKSTWTKQQVRKARRLLVWDPDGEYQVNRYSSKSAFLDAVMNSYRVPNFPIGNEISQTKEQPTIGNRISYSTNPRYRLGLSIDPTPANFEWFAQVCMTVAHARYPIVVVAEEIADVTSVGKAGVSWGTLCRRGRKYGIQLYAITQRPAECDKTIYSQAAFKWLGYMDNETDQKRMAQLFGIDHKRVAGIQPLQYLYKQPGVNKELKIEKLKF